jgi:hypothetical protein
VQIARVDWPNGGAHMCSWGFEAGDDPSGDILDVCVAWPKFYSFIPELDLRGSVQIEVGSSNPAGGVIDRWYRLKLATPAKNTTSGSNSNKPVEAYIRLRVDFSPPLPVRECCICCAPVPARSIGQVGGRWGAQVNCYECPVDTDGHLQCKECFRNYIRVCCDDYMLGKLPIACPMCKHPVAEESIRSLVDDQQWTKYINTSISAGMNDRSCKDSVPVTCQKCASYHEFFPKDYQTLAKEAFHQLISDQVFVLAKFADTNNSPTLIIPRL